MAIISNNSDFKGKFNFIFSGNDIILWNNKLPDGEICRNFIKNQVASDWYEETELNYSAVLLENDAPLPADCTQIPLRQFFWDTRKDNNRFFPSETACLAARAHSFLLQRSIYLFCPSCGTKLMDDSHFSARLCPHCKKQWFPRIEPCIIVLVSKGDEILLVRNKNYAQDHYACVAGFVEQGETIEQAVHREVLEETGIEIKNVRYAGSQSWPFPDQLMLAFHADYKSGEICIQEEELSDARWFKKESAPVMPKPGSVAYNLVNGLL